jgi:hypothetical protein
MENDDTLMKIVLLTVAFPVVEMSDADTLVTRHKTYATDSSTYIMRK